MLSGRCLAVIVAVEEAVGSIDIGRTVDVSDNNESDEGGLSSGTVTVVDRHSGLKLL